MVTLTVNTEIENEIINQLKGFKSLCGRIRVLESEPVGMGFTVSRTSEDKLQELHGVLRGLRPHMYLSQREQDLNTAAHAHLSRYPAGIASQHREVAQQQGVDAEDSHDLRDLTRRVQKVREARSMTRDGYSGVDDKLTELQDKMFERNRIANILEALSEIRPEYTALLRNRFIEGKSVKEVTLMLCISTSTYDRWRDRAFKEYAKLMG